MNFLKKKLYFYLLIIFNYDLIKLNIIIILKKNSIFFNYKYSNFYIINFINLNIFLKL